MLQIRLPRTHAGKARRLARWGPAAVAAALVLVAAACGDDDQERAETSVVDSGEVPSTDTTETTAAAEGDDDSETTPADTEVDDSGALLLVMDSSGSMNSRDEDSGERLIDLAKSALGEVVDELPDGQHVGLRVYGHRYPNTDRENGCTDTELIHPVEPLDRSALMDSIDSYDAQGFTPIGLSLREAADDLPPEGERTIILVSDGQETCDTDPCQAAEDLAAEGVDLVVHTVGFVLDMAAPDEADQARSELSCVAEATGGSFVDVDDADDLADALEDVAREDRGFDSDGGTLEGNPVPRDATTGTVDASYTDRVLGMETNYYRFEIDPGSTVSAELTRMGNPEVGSVINPYQCEQVQVTDVSGQPLASAGLVPVGEDGWIRDAGDTQTWFTDAVQVDTDEVWIAIVTEACGSGIGHPDAEYDVQLRLTLID